MRSAGLVLGSIAVGWVTARIIVMVSAPVLEAPVLRRENYRNATLATARGIVILLTVLATESIRVLYAAFGFGSRDVSELRSAVFLGVMVYGFLGLVDDCLAVGADRGFRGHIGALLHGRVTSGMLKMIGGGAVAMLIVASPGFPSGRNIIVDGVLIAACANAGNLFDRAPARTIKIATLGFVPVWIALGAAAGPVAIVIGAGLGLIPEERNERAMLGDTGANPLGAVIGIGLVFGASATGRLIACGIALAINLAAERWSYSEIIENNAALRTLDGIGQSPQRRQWARRRAEARKG